MTTALVFSLIGSAGFLAGVAALLNFLNTRRSTRTKGGAEAYKAYQEFVHGATDDRDKEINRLKSDKVVLLSVREKLVDISQDLIRFAKSKGATNGEVEHFQDRLDATRLM